MWKDNNHLNHITDLEELTVDADGSKTSRKLVQEQSWMAKKKISKVNQFEINSHGVSSNNKGQANKETN